jgi:hypothetical protein
LGKDAIKSGVKNVVADFARQNTWKLGKDVKKICRLKCNYRFQPDKIFGNFIKTKGKFVG